MSTSEGWYYVEGGERRGPGAWAEAVRPVRGGVIPADGIVGRVGAGEWVVAGAVNGLVVEEKRGPSHTGPQPSTSPWGGKLPKILGGVVAIALACAVVAHLVRPRYPSPPGSTAQTAAT